ncbi:MAG TPA: ABC transporter ATP-binding protein [Thiobacillaceae bacterium]|nr:ABC transporter ATP-binding protein [Thiobacillaceae bacterium]HNU62957.1 ABC transporter ATP-binding protein [Thiobacillaceae bacterium]
MSRRGLRVEGLRVQISQAGRLLVPVDDVGFAIGANECVALLGESGCGKSLTALALMRLLPEVAQVTAGRVDLGDTDLLGLPELAMRGVRGGRLAMIFQEPMTSLNPVMRVADQIGEALAAHRGLVGEAARAEVERLLQAVGLDAGRQWDYPFQLSGGQRQRALIAMMLAGEPEVLIADEPTTALDVLVQDQILKLLKDLQTRRGMSLLLITHDLDVAGDMADRVAVMYAGQIVEWASRASLYATPRHPYTRKLFAVLPRPERRGQRLDSLPGRVPAADAQHLGCRFADRCPEAFPRCHGEAPSLLQVAPDHAVRCHLFFPADIGNGASARVAAPISPPPPARVESMQPEPGEPGPPRGRAADALLEVRDLAVHFPIRRGLLRRVVGSIKAVDGVSLSIAPGETLALVGESGCGKTTLARAVLRLLEPTAGQVMLAGRDLAGLRGERLRRLRREMQIVFQDPFSSLNPRMKVGAILEEGMRSLLPELDAQARSERVAVRLEQVGLPADAAGRHPHEFSGGQRQRIAIARALTVEPRLLILDEPTSALDVSVQAQILNLLADIQARQGLAYLFITHNLSVVGYLAQRVAVMQGGRVVEEGRAETLLARPRSDYTRRLLAAAPGHLRA